MWYRGGMSTTPATTSIVPYAGWARNLRIANADVEMIVTLDVGPRVIRYAAPGGPNLFGETADQLGKSGEPHWMPRGGHRLWTAPEDKTRTYAPDNRAVEHRVLSSDAKGVSVRFTQLPDEPYGVQKELDITLDADGQPRRARPSHHQRRRDAGASGALGAHGDAARRDGDHPAAGASARTRDRCPTPSTPTTGPTRAWRSGATPISRIRA